MATIVSGVPPRSWIAADRFQNMLSVGAVVLSGRRLVAGS
jgi:hypothetical protein